MTTHKRLSDLLRNCDSVYFSDRDKIVIMSDCHRGDASWADNFASNQNIYYQALSHYYRNGYIYIEMGDGDELWKNKSLSEIKEMHSDVFNLLSDFHRRDRLFMLFGNHDMAKKYGNFSSGYFCRENSPGCDRHFDNMKIHEGLLLRHKEDGGTIFLVHGHQGDLINDRFWKLGRFLVRYIWRPLSFFGANDPTLPAKNYKKKESTERKLAAFASEREQMMIAGHTHRPVFPKPKESLYFNDGCCVHPRSITAIEICAGKIVLVKWRVAAHRDGSLFVQKEIIAGPHRLSEYFK
ncbi:MAG: metallophosphoesterase [Oscillospiraceae bacterium]|jgi:UDP-2,3-diacylglucosamine pyrophosphatase LpxH|nr:metallophosphoesterase [Oscillospiraceae bacterium]